MPDRLENYACINCLSFDCPLFFSPRTATTYAWVVVFVLPINSAINPVIYTLAAPTGLSKRAYRSLGRFFSQSRNYLLSFVGLFGITRQGTATSNLKQRLDSGTVLGASNSNADQNLSSSLYSRISDLTQNTNTRSSNGSVISMKTFKGGNSHQLTVASSGANVTRRASFPHSLVYSTRLESDRLSNITSKIIAGIPSNKLNQEQTNVTQL